MSQETFPWKTWISLPQIPAASTRMITSPRPHVGSGTSRSSTLPLPFAVATTALIRRLGSLCRRHLRRDTEDRLICSSDVLVGVLRRDVPEPTVRDEYPLVEHAGREPCVRP